MSETAMPGSWPRFPSRGSCAKHLWIRGLRIDVPGWSRDDFGGCAQRLQRGIVALLPFSRNGAEAATFTPSLEAEPTLRHSQGGLFSGIRGTRMQYGIDVPHAPACAVPVGEFSEQGGKGQGLRGRATMCCVAQLVPNTTGCPSNPRCELSSSRTLRVPVERSDPISGRSHRVQGCAHILSTTPP